MKTNDHNKQLYRDMQEAPDKYSDQEIEAMMDDLDQMPDVDEAWQQFSENEELRMKNEEFATALPTVQSHSSLRKMAASFVGLLLVSGIAFAAVHIVRQSQHENQPAMTVEKPQSTVTVSQTLPADSIVKTGSVVFDNVPLDSIAKAIAAYHHLDMDLQNSQANQLRFYFVWNQSDGLQEVIEKLNMFEQVNLAVEDDKLIVR